MPENTLVPILTRKERQTLQILRSAWLLGVGIFFIWWFLPSHVGTTFGFTLTTLVIAWSFFSIGWCFFFMTKMHKPHPELPLPRERVAMIVTKAPSEPFSVVQATLEGMLTQKYAHHTWVADEDPTPEALHWYATHGVNVSCRKGDARYNNESWPRRRKCKEGNLAYFYDNYGYEKYDIVVQMDADHVPGENYLEEMIRPFSDPEVGYVAAPSLCDSNTKEAWAARARSKAEAMFHGPIQSGTNDGWSPTCIGSHYAVRTTALKEIGGIGPELAEDYSTTLFMTAYGWRGVWASNAEAHGEGPHTFLDIIIQDYQWARSMLTIFLAHYFTHWGDLSAKGRFQATFAQTWYSVKAFVWATAFLLPIITLLTGIAPVNVSFITFLGFIFIPYVLSWIVYGYIHRKGHLRPHNVPLWSWEEMLFELARWPWIVVASFDAIVSYVLNRKHAFRVTPKDKSQAGNLSFKILSPYIFIVVADLVALALRNSSQSIDGYAWFVFVSLFSYSMLLTAVTLLHYQKIIADVNTLLLSRGAGAFKYAQVGVMRLFM